MTNAGGRVTSHLALSMSVGRHSNNDAGDLFRWRPAFFFFQSCREVLSAPIDCDRVLIATLQQESHIPFIPL
jgi:hypothetical protein